MQSTQSPKEQEQPLEASYIVFQDTAIISIQVNDCSNNVDDSLQRQSTPSTQELYEAAIEGRNNKLVHTVRKINRW